MADNATFPTLTSILVSGNNVANFKVGAAVKAGQVVKIAATGVDLTVHPAVKESGECPIGVALTAASTTTGVVAVAMAGCIVNVVNADDTTAIDAGHLVITNDNAIGGTVSEVLAVGSDATPQNIVGRLVEDMAGGVVPAKMLVLCGVTHTAHA